MPLPSFVNRGAVGLAMRSGEAGLGAVGDASLHAASASAASVGAKKRFIIMGSSTVPVALDAMGGWRSDGVRAFVDASSSMRDAVHDPEPRPGAFCLAGRGRNPTTVRDGAARCRVAAGRAVTSKKKPAGPVGPAGFLP